MATVRDLVRVAVRAAEEKKAKDVQAIDIRGLSGVTDYMIIATGSSDTNVRAIAEGVREKLLEKGERPFSLEGLQEGTWVLLDYVDFVVHVFHYEKRVYFGLEELWADAKLVPLADTAARRTAVRSDLKTAARPAARTAGKEAQPTVPRTALKPTGKKSVVPKKTGVRKAAAPKKAVVSKTATRKKTAGAKNTVAPKKTSAPGRSAVPKPKKTAVPKRRTKA
ncbi:MAG: ribosome silencing factor [Candidatus Methylomirabilia bacterium]